MLKEDQTLKQTTLSQLLEVGCIGFATYILLLGADKKPRLPLEKKT